jgi:hypothetical protein
MTYGASPLGGAAAGGGPAPRGGAGVSLLVAASQRASMRRLTFERTLRTPSLR